MGVERERNRKREGGRERETEREQQTERAGGNREINFKKEIKYNFKDLRTHRLPDRTFVIKITLRVGHSLVTDDVSGTLWNTSGV